MARFSKRLYLVLCLCLLLQQFGPVITNSLHKSHKRIPSSRRTKIKNDALEKVEMDKSGAKRGVYFELIKLLGKQTLKTITFGSYGVTFAVTIIQAVKGCSATYPSIKTNFEEFQRLQQRYDEVKTKIRDQSRQALSREIYVNDSYNAYQETRKQMLRISDEATLVLKSLGPEVGTLLVNVTDDMGRLMEKLNSTEGGVDILQVNDKFSEGLDLALRITIPGLALAVPGFRALWKNHLKDSFIGKKIQEIGTRIKAKFATLSSSASVQAKKAFAKLSSTGFLGKAKTAIVTNLKKIVGYLLPKLEKFRNVFANLKLGIKGLVKLGGAALAVWTAVETFRQCQQKQVEAENSVRDMRKNVKDLEEYHRNITEMNERVNEAWTDVRNYTLSSEMLGALETLKEMITDEYLSRDEQERMDVANRIQSYIDATELDCKAEESKSELSKRQRDMNEVLGTIAVTLKCYKYKGIAFENVKEFCALGDSPFKKVYKDSTKESQLDERLDCTRRTGETYISEQAMKKAWEHWVSTNQTVEPICLMNNPGIVEDIKDLLKRGKTDPDEITNQVISIPRKREISQEEITKIIEKIMEENPDIANQLPDDLVGYICQLKRDGMSTQDIIKALNVVAKDKINRELTEADVEGASC